MRIGVRKNFRERNRMFLGRDLLHVGPIRDDTVLNGILEHVVSRGPAPLAIAAGELAMWPTSRVLTIVQQHKKKATNLFEQKKTP